MKILQVFDFFSVPHGGGTVDLVYKLSRALAQKGHEVVIYTSDLELDQPYIDSLPEAKVHLFHHISGLAGFHIMTGMVSEVRKRLTDFDIVHLHCMRSFQNMVLHHYATKYGVPYVVDAHGSLPRGTGGKRVLKWLFDVVFGYKILNDAGRVIAETEFGIEEYKELGVRDEKIIRIPPPFPVEEFSQLPPRGQFRSQYNIREKHVVMFLGRIYWLKGLDFLVEGFYELSRLREDVILAIVGSDDGYQHQLEELINRLELSDKVLFTGFQGGENKLAALVDADVVVQTSRYEQGAWAPFEAILCGTPIIVTRHTGAGEDVKRIDAGYLVEFGNKTELAQLILRVLEDPAEAKTKATKAAQYIRENLSLAKNIADYEKVYRECIAENKRLRRDTK